VAGPSEKASATSETYRRAAAFLEGGDKRWRSGFFSKDRKSSSAKTGRRRSECTTLKSCSGPRDLCLSTTYCVIEHEGSARSYAQDVRARPTLQNDPQLLVQVAQGVLFLGPAFSVRARSNSAWISISGRWRNPMSTARNRSIRLRRGATDETSARWRRQFQRLEELLKMPTARLKM